GPGCLAAAAAELSPNSHPGLGVADAISLISTSSTLGLRGRIRGDKKNGGSRGVGASSSAGTKSSGCSGFGMYTGTWSAGTYFREQENVVPAPTTVGQPPCKDPQMEYSKIVPQSEQKYR
ncbi:hypothetical protein Tco_1010882, partial [Tanacetum coccineum]